MLRRHREQGRKAEAGGAGKTRRISPYFDAPHIAVFSLLLLLAYLPYFVIFNPGIVEIDTIFQLAEFEGYGYMYGTDGQFTRQFPMFDVFLFGSLFELGKLIGGSQQVGILAIEVFQVMTCAAALSSACCYLSRWKVPAWLRWMAFLFVALVPTFPLMAVDLGKDTVFVAALVPFCCCVLEGARKAFEGEKTTGAWVAGLVLFSALSALTISKGSIIVLISLAALALAAWRSRPARRTAMCALTSTLCLMAAMSVLVTAPLTEGNESTPVQMSLRESLSLPIQQITYALKNGAEVSDEELGKFGAFYDYEQAIRDFQPSMTDNAKICVRDDVGYEDAMGFLQAYVAVGMREPGMYWEAFSELLGEYWVYGTSDAVMLPRLIGAGEYAGELKAYGVDGYGFYGTSLPDDMYTMAKLIRDGAWLYSFTDLPEWSSTHPEFQHWQQDPGYKETANLVLSRIVRVAELPVVGLLLQKPTYATFLPALTVLLLLFAKPGRRWRFLLAAAPLALSVAVAFVSPVAFTRYLYPSMVLCALYLPIAVSEAGRRISEMRSKRNDAKKETTPGVEEKCAGQKRNRALPA